jgi:hypothetical protein
MQLLHSAATKAAPVDKYVEAKELFDGDSLLAGAVEYPPEGTDDDDVVDHYYQAFSVHQKDSIVAGCDDFFVLGNYAMMIEEVLQARHQADVPAGCSCLEKVEDFELCSGEQTPFKRYPGGTKAKTCITGWIVHDRPFTRETSVDALQTLSARVGPIIVPGTTVHSLGNERDMNIDGFTVVYLRSGRARINYNPKAIERRPFLTECRLTRKRLSGKMPEAIFHRLVGYLHAGKWPKSHPFECIVPSTSMYTSGGWGSQSDNTFGAVDVLMMRDLTLKLWPRVYWWRDETGPYSSQNQYTFAGAIQDALLYLHGIEAHAKDALEIVAAEANEDYDWRTKDDLWSEETPPTREEHVEYWGKAHDLGRWHTNLKFCKFLRSEAKAMKIKIPKPPVMPLSPTALRKLAAAKHKKRRKKR